ncbi:SRPBCC family protein [Aquimarina longa]|uniref:SRPBCC family protein n=1 Tax=Aquimarina longa TaxID=1080221 RepID=UPI0007820DE8|nr:SRPBCC domain-containing protein [Aquimarina longa]
MKNVIRKEQVLNHPIDTIWNAITIQEEISTWFINADFKAEVGYKYTFTAPKEQNCPQITGEVKKADPYTLIYTWIVANTNVETVVKWELEKTETGTKLYLEHSGIANYSGDTAVSMFTSFNSGWDNCILGLLEYLKNTVHAR